jgi:cytidine deaminase
MHSESTLIEAAWHARESAYAPYSGFHVGAALLGADGRIYTGCNVENLSYGLTNCAERVALQSAIVAGCREFLRIVIAADTREAISPCGACRQVLAEFAPKLEIISVGKAGVRERWTLDTLLPRPATGILETSNTKSCFNQF